MVHDKNSVSEIHSKHRKDNYEDWGMKNWRAWGSWFSWGSPVGLGLFFISVAITVWIFVQTFK